jgi:hypothetical protein
MEQLTVLAEAMGESLTAQRLEIYARDLADLTQEKLAGAFSRARRELRFFPKIAELRELAGNSRKELTEGGSIAAWHEVQRFLSRWGVDRRTHSVYGPPPDLGARTEYAIRVVGGLNRINRASDHDIGYIQKQFQEAWMSFDVANSMSFSDLVMKLDGEPLRRQQRLTTGDRLHKHLAATPVESPPAQKQSEPPAPKRTSPLPRISPLTNDEAREKRIAELKAQAERAQQIAHSAAQKKPGVTDGVGEAVM